MLAFDLHTLAVIFGVAFAGGIIGLDRTAAGQFMISQPIVAGPVTGWLLGDVATGMMIGAVLELIWVLDMPVGTFVPADATVGAVSATAIAVLAGGGKPAPDLAGFSIIISTVTVPITMILDRLVRSRNSQLVEAASPREGEDAGRRVAKIHLSGLLVFFLKSFVLSAVFIPVGLAAAALFRLAPQPFHGAMVFFVKALPLLAAAVVFGKLSRSVADRSFFLGFLAAVGLTLALQVNPFVTVLLIGGGLAIAGIRSARPS